MSVTQTRSTPNHHWSEWYAGSIVAREGGKTPDEAVNDAASSIERSRQ